MNNIRHGPGKNYRDIDDPAQLICTIPPHSTEYDGLGACLICRVPTVAGLHPTARAALLRKRPDLAYLAPAASAGSGDATDPAAEVSLPPATAAGSPTPKDTP